MLSQHMRSFIERLHIKTKERKLEWVRVSWGDGYETTLANHNVTISRGTDDPNHPRADECLLLRILDEAGSQVAVATLSPDLHGAHERYFHMAKQLFFNASQSSTGADETIATLLEALDDI